MSAVLDCITMHRSFYVPGHSMIFAPLLNSRSLFKKIIFVIDCQPIISSIINLVHHSPINYFQHTIT